MKEVVKSLVVSARERDVLYAGLSNGDVWHTADYGENWQRLPFNLGHISREMIMLHEK